MALLGMVEHDDYMPEFGTLAVRDFPGGSGVGQRDVGPLTEYATDAQPCGTIARAGYGWLEAAAADGSHLVRLEHHDSAPLIDSASWDDVVETPYGVAGDGVGLTYVTGGPGSADLTLAAGLYRVRVARAGGDGPDERWLLQFWADADAEPPRWLSRQRPAAPAGITGWLELLGYEASDLLSVVDAAGGSEGATFDQLTAWAAAHRRPAEWLDQPLFPAPTQPPPMGHAALDLAAQQQRAKMVAENERKLAELSGFAAQLGVAGPSTQRGLLELLVVAGVLVSDASDRFRIAADPPAAWDVLELPARRVEVLQSSDSTRRYASLASDIVSTVAWSRHDGAYGAARFTVPELADRLLASPVKVQAALRYAVSTQLLAVDGDKLTVLAKRAPSRQHGH